MNRMRGYLLIILALKIGIGCQLVAQVPLKVFNADNGLLSSETYQVLQDHKGYIWITTDEGVSRYDGYGFEHYNLQNGLPESTVLELFEDYKNRLWFIMITNELAYLDNDSLVLYPYNKVLQRKKYRNFFPIKKSFYVDSSDNVYIGIYQQGVFKIDNFGEISYLNDDSSKVNFIQPVESSILFTGRKHESWQLSIENPFVKNSIYQFLTSTISCRTVFEKYNNKYYYTDYNHLLIYSGNGDMEHYEFEHDILWMSTDNNNNLWFGFHHGGAVVYEDSTFSQKKYHLLPEHSVSSVLEDNEGSIWISTLYNGVYMFSPLSYANFGIEEGVIDLPITQITSYKNSLLFAGTGSNLYQYNDGTITKRSLNLKHQNVLCKFLDTYGDSILISHGKNGNRIIYKNQIQSTVRNYSTAVSPFDSGLIYLHSTAINTWKKGKQTGEWEGKNYSDVYGAVPINDSLIWIITNNGLLSFSTGDDFPIEKHISPELNSHLSSIVMSRDSVFWIGSHDYGIISINKNKVKSFNPEVLNQKTISCLLDLDSLLIVGTNDGIILFEKDRDSLITENAIKINSSNGLKSNVVFDVAYNSGSLYVANSKGVSRLPIGLTFDASPLYFTKFKVNSNDTLIKEHYELAYNENFIEVEFLALNYQSNQDVKYSYMLEGMDRDWRSTSDRIAQYSALPPGEYLFKLRATNSYSIQNKEPLTISIIINKPYYKTAWFILLMIFAGLLIVFIIFLIVLRFRLKEASKRYSVEQELNRSRQQALSAQMNPHFIYNSLNSVQSYILKNERVKASEYLSKLGRLMRDILNNSQNQTITLREEFDALEKYMEMEQLRFKDLFTYKFNVCSNIDLDRIQVPPLIIQPFVENAIHHGLRLRKEGGELLVDASIMDNALQILIQDNGVGIENAKQYNSKTRKNHKSFGTEITHKRLQLLEEMNKEKVTLSVSQAYPENNLFPGTKVILLINLS